MCIWHVWMLGVSQAGSRCYVGLRAVSKYKSDVIVARTGEREGRLFFKDITLLFKCRRWVVDHVSTILFQKGIWEHVKG